MARVALLTLALLTAGAGTLPPQAQADEGLRSLPARVVLDPRRELRLAAPQDGRIEAIRGRALPQAGEELRAGELIAWLRPVLAQTERRELGVDLAEAERDRAVGQLQLDRFGIKDAPRFEIPLPTPTIQILTDFRIASARAESLQGALNGRIALRAPRSGRVLRSQLREGQAVSAGGSLIELSAPGALAVELRHSEPALDAARLRTALTADGERLPLQLLGESYDPQLRQRLALYAVLSEPVTLAVNQPLSLEWPSAAVAP